tara:strand:+ start:333 stop:527 length:195 start_codon:yes stop_codon:yes gene_type:complete
MESSVVSVLAYVEGEWLEVLQSSEQREEVMNLLAKQFHGRKIPLASNPLPLDIKDYYDPIKNGN